jgi:lipopolysaccharide/colanic/teichoic acid biosynthesis glycosyltransferase
MVAVYFIVEHVGVQGEFLPPPSQMLLELTLLIFTVLLGRQLSSTVAKFEQVFESVVVGADETRVLDAAQGEQTISEELFRARRFSRPVTFVVLKTSTTPELQPKPFEGFNHTAVLQRRYLKTRVAQIAESLLYYTDPITYYDQDLVICLPETSREEALALAKQLFDLNMMILNINVKVGIASFPNDGLIFDDLVQAASAHLCEFEAVEKPRQPHPQHYATPSEAMKPVHRTSGVLFSVLNDFFQGGGFQPLHASAGAYAVQATPYYHPDFWINRLPYQSINTRLIYRKIKRAMDIGLVLLSAPLTVPVGLVIAALIKLQDGGSILFVQRRTGRGGRKFGMLKFRSMIPNADQRLYEMGVRVNERGETINERGEKLEDDPRITRIGKILRKTSLDELPQLWNVLRGDMSLVGPRPTSFGVDKYSLLHTERLSVRPGITGLWQIYDRGDTDFNNRLVWDIKYIDKMSLSLDIHILVRTVLRVFKHRGAR